MTNANAIQEASKLLHLSERALKDAKVPITPVQYSVLAIVGEIGLAAMADMARRLVVKPTVITGIVDRLEALEYIERKYDLKSQTDRRIKWIHLTERGRQVLADASAALEAAA